MLDPSSPQVRAVLPLLYVAWADGVLTPSEAEVLCDALRDRPESEPEPPEASFDVSAMTELLDGDYGDLRDRIRTLLRDPMLEYQDDLGTPAYRKQVLRWCQQLAEQVLGRLGIPEEYGGEGDMEPFDAFVDVKDHLV